MFYIEIYDFWLWIIMRSLQKKKKKENITNPLLSRTNNWAIKGTSFLILPSYGPWRCVLKTLLEADLSIFLEEPEWKAKQRAEIRTSPAEIRPSSTLTTNQKHSLKTSEFLLYLLMIQIWKGILMWRLTKGQIQRKGVTLFRSHEEEFRTLSAMQEPLVIAFFSPSKR